MSEDGHSGFGPESQSAINPSLELVGNIIAKKGPPKGNNFIHFLLHRPQQWVRVAPKGINKIPAVLVGYLFFVIEKLTHQKHRIYLKINYLKN